MRLSDFAIQPTKDKIESLACIAIARRFSAESEDTTPPGLVECLSGLLEETSPAIRPLLQATIQSIQNNISIIETSPTDLALSLANFAEKYHLPGRTWDRIMDDAGQALKELRLARAITDQDLSRITEAWAELQHPAVSHGGFKLIKVDGLSCSPPAWIVRDYLEDNSLAVVFGDSGSGKSFLGIDISCCIATGKDWMGNAIKSSGPVAYILGEGGNGFARRLRAWSIRHQINIDDIPLYTSNRPAALCEQRSVNEVTKAIDDIAKSTAPRLIVIDTLARNFGTGDENSTQDMTKFVQAADIIRTRYQCSILIIHHTGHAVKKRERGASPLRGAIDASYRMSKDESGLVRFVPLKMKEAELPEPMAFNIRSVELGFQDDDGREVTSAILDQIPYEAPAPSKKGKGKWQQQALTKLEELYRTHRANLENKGYDPEQARVSISVWRDACLEAGMPNNRFYDAKKSLSESGHISSDHNYVYLL